MLDGAALGALVLVLVGVGLGSLAVGNSLMGVLVTAVTKVLVADGLAVGLVVAVAPRVASAGSVVSDSRSSVGLVERQVEANPAEAKHVRHAHATKTVKATATNRARLFIVRTLPWRYARNTLAKATASARHASTSVKQPLVVLL